jgi:hypothetical protein
LTKYINGVKMSYFERSSRKMKTASKKKS